MVIDRPYSGTAKAYLTAFNAAKTHDASFARDQIRNTETMRNVGIPRISGRMECSHSLLLVFIDSCVMAASREHFVFKHIQRIDVVL